MITRLKWAAGRFVGPGVLDALVVFASLLLAWSGRSITANLSIRPALSFGLLAVAVYLVANWAFGLYRRIWRYASANETLVISASVASGTGLLLLADILFYRTAPRLVPLSVVLFTGLFVLVGFTVVRYQRRVWTGSRRLWRLLRRQPLRERSRLLIVGAGEAGQLLARRVLSQEEDTGDRVVGFVDDDPDKVGMSVHGLPVLGDRHAIPRLVARYHVDLVIIAVDDPAGQALPDTLQICEATTARVKVLPDVFGFIHGTRGLPPLRDITMEDLLGRQPVSIDREACRHLLACKTVLVTGAAGSIGSELCRQVLTFQPQCLLMLDNNESGLYNLLLELAADGISPCIQAIIGDVTSVSKIQAIFARHRPQIVFHAAAYKHVPLMEEHPDEAVRVNVLGTRNVADAACRYQAERFVFISTDKAVNPASVMGATKRIGEMLVSCLANGSQTLCTAVRFGNVLGSRGSVVPTFERQIEMGGPITITHPDMTRYFMSTHEAVSLVIQAASLTVGGDIFILDMGEQVRIEQLALRLIRLRGLRPAVDIPIKYIGVRSGEKLHERLTGDQDETQPTGHPSISRVNGNDHWDRDSLYSEIEELARVAENGSSECIIRILWKIVG